jgi:hypothetical protein
VIKEGRADALYVVSRQTDRAELWDRGMRRLSVLLPQQPRVIQVVLIRMRERAILGAWVRTTDGASSLNRDVLQPR